MREDAQDAVSRVDEQRLWGRLMEMAQIGAIPGGGVNRAAFSQEDVAARKLLISWSRAHGFSVAQDDPHAAPVITGSHMDSQPRGGRFDGIYGVLAGLEALEAMERAGVKTRHPVELVAWSNEEGGRFPPCTMGSAVYTRARPLGDFLDVKDNEGVALKDALARTLAATPDAGKRALNSPAAAYIEAHIEQGPLLEQERKAIGVVTGIQGLRWFNVELFGETAHAGTTPLAGRKDALRGQGHADTARRSVRLRSGGGGLRGAGGAGAPAAAPAHALRRESRCHVHGAGVPDRDDLRAVREGRQPQRGGERPARGPRGRRARADGRAAGAREVANQPKATDRTSAAGHASPGVGRDPVNESRFAGESTPLS